MFRANAPQFIATSGGVSPRAGLVYRTRHEFFSRAGFPGDQHGHVGHGRLADGVADVFHKPALLLYDFAIAPIGIQPCAQGAVFSDKGLVVQQSL